jgi:hypothetical protein
MSLLGRNQRKRLVVFRPGWPPSLPGFSLLS